jgi:endogenous inhibitor of DNA gyrase (YacG/DUF329 family)
MGEIEEMNCPKCATPALHLADIRYADAHHLNKVNLHFNCDACGKDSIIRVWGHHGEQAEKLAGVTTVE